MKKIISALLVVVMLFGFVPISKAAQNVMGATSASAQEAVPGSFNYLKGLIKASGTYDSSMGGYYVTYMTKSYRLSYNEYYNEIRYGMYGLSISYGGMRLKEDSYIAIKKDGSCYGRVLATAGSMDINIYASIEPSTYYSGKPLNYSATVNGSPYPMNDASTNNSYDKSFSSIIDIFNNLLKQNTVITIGNFGFTRIAEPKEISNNIEDSVVVYYKDVSRFLLAAEDITNEVPVLSDVYSSTNPSVVSIDSQGNFTAVGRGKASVTRTVTDINGTVYTQTHNITVKFTLYQWIIWIFLLGFIWY